MRCGFDVLVNLMGTLEDAGNDVDRENGAGNQYAAGEVVTQIFAETAVDKLVGKALLSFTGTKLVHDGVTYADSELACAVGW